MKKSIFLFFAAILCAMSISAANMKGGEVLYLKPNSNWTQANARFAIYLCNGSSGAKWVKMTKSGDYYMATVPTGDYKNVIFCRMNPANTTDDWNSKWNQSGDLSFDQKKNLCTINSGQWDCGTNVTWSTHKPTSTASLATSSANIFVGGQATLTPSISNTDVNTLKSTSYAISPATGASISGNTFTATTEGEYTITATVTYYPNGCTGLTSGLNTATATTTITASVPAEETNNVTVSYKFESTEIASATTIASVGVETPSEATAPAITGYTFANWTLGAGVATEDELTANPINIITKSGETDYTLTANYEKFKLTYTVTVPEGTEKCYIVGEMNGWDIDNPIEMTSQGSNVFTVTLEDVTKSTQYKYTSQKSWDYADVQESNRTWSANDVVTAWKDPLATNVHLAGTMTDWDNNKIEFKKATKEATTASIILNLTAGDYKFKIVDNGSWLGNNATIDKTISGWTFASDKGDCPLEATIAGDYTFTWAISTKKLSVTYPTICAITATANDAAMGTIAGAGDYGKGSTATLTATPNDGYLFVNWTKGGDVVSNDKTYSFKVTEAVELVANFEEAAEEVHNVTVSYVCGGNKIADDQTISAVGVTTPQSVEAPAIFGYTFASWTLGAGVTSSNTTANPISINTIASGSDFTLTANYTEIPKVTVYFVNNKKWSKVNAYGWKDGEAQGTPAWPGQEITANKETEQVADFDVYSYSVVPGSYDNIIFNDGSGTQTATFKWTDGKYYYMNAADKYAGGTAEEVATALGAIVSYDYYIYGNMNDWKEDANYGMTDENEDGIYEKTLTFKNNAELKVKGTAWYGSESVERTYKEVSDNGGNIKLSLGADTEVTVMFNSNTKKISFEGLTIDGDVVTYSYYIADDGSLSGNSNWSSKSIGLTDDNSDGIYEKTFTNQAIGTYLMKVTNGTWDDGCVWGFSNVEGAYKEVAAAASDNNIEIKLTAATTFTVKFNSETKKITFDNLTEETPVVEDFSNQPSVIYIKCDDWKVDNARFAAYFFGTEEKWVSMTDVDNDGIYEVVNDKKNKNVIFCRMNPANNENKWGENNSHVWNQSADLEIPTTTYLNYWTVTSTDDVWNKPTGKWMMLIGSGDNSEALTAADGQAVADVYVNRSFTAGQLYTIALPFDLNADPTKTHFGADVKVIKFAQLEKDENGDLVLWFEEALGMAAGKPYVITPSNTIDGFTVNNVVINNTPNNVQQTTTGAQVTMEAVLSASKGATTNGRYWLASDTYLYNVSSALKSLRAVFNIQSNKANVRARVAFGENIETGVDNTITTDAPVKAIVNGQLIIIRDGVKYNVQGQKL